MVNGDNGSVIILTIFFSLRLQKLIFHSNRLENSIFMPPAVIDGFARFKIRRERKIPGLVLTKVTLLDNGQAALNGLRFGAGTLPRQANRNRNV
jgi:hypothetical protein